MTNKKRHKVQTDFVDTSFVPTQSGIAPSCSVTFFPIRKVEVLIFVLIAGRVPAFGRNGDENGLGRPEKPVLSEFLNRNQKTITELSCNFKSVHLCVIGTHKFEKMCVMATLEEFSKSSKCSFFALGKNV